MDSTATNFVLSQYDIFIKNQTRTAEIPTGVQAIGCYLDSANRTLPVQMWGGKNTNNTAASCSTACAAAGYVYSGTESSSECYCGNTKPADSFIDDGCNSKCSGDNIQYCGGSHRLNVYYNSLITPGATSMVSSTTSTSTTTTSTGTTTTSTTTSTTTTSPTTTSTSTTTTSTSTSTTSTVSATSLPSGIVPYGCFVDSSSRVLPVNVYSNASNTPALCARACRQAGYVYAGTEWHDECWCGNIAPSTVANSSDCSTACDGDATQECGGGYRLSVTKDTSVTVVTPTLPSGVISLGCYADNQSSRTLPYQAYSGPNNNNSACSLLCRAGHYPYSGTEYGKECWCGHSLPSNLMADNSTCNMVCTGDNVEHCGAGLRLSVHQDTTIPTSTQALPSGIVALGCYTDTASYSNARTLPTLLYSNSSNSDSVCALACRDAGYPISGTEYSNECWCGLIAPATSLATTNSSCTMPCPGIGNQICGGSWLLNIQQDTTVRPATPLPSGWTSLGCYEDFSTRTLPVMAWRTSSNSDTSCLNQCQADGYDYAGTENGNECWCGSVAPNSTLVASTSDCDMPCAGDTTQVCGAGFRLSTFQYTAAASAKSRRSGAMGRYSR